MKNIQIIDRADNATYSIFMASEDTFQAIFPEPGQDIEIVEDFINRAGEEQAIGVLSRLWDRPVHKARVSGIHGTLFYDYERKKGNLPGSKRELDRASEQLNPAQRELYQQLRARKEDQ